jgi:methyltransferase family protein
MFNRAENVLKLIRPGDRVLDVGGGMDPFPRADAVMDMEPYPAHVARLKAKGEQTRFAPESWFVGDICHPQVWTRIPDQAFDFVVCSHTLEDVRDPVFVCSQLQRVARAGYIETPSKFRECAKATRTDVISGWDHHRWIVEVEDGTLFFKLKNPFIHHFDYLGEARRRHVFDYYNMFLAVHWRGSFDYAERTHKGAPIETEDLFHYYDHYAYGHASDLAPPAFFTIDSPFKGKTVLLGNEYVMPVERAFSHAEIKKKHDDRLAREGRLPPPPPPRAVLLVRAILRRLRRMIP